MCREQKYAIILLTKFLRVIEFTIMICIYITKKIRFVGLSPKTPTMKAALVVLGLWSVCVTAYDYCLERAPSGAVNGCSVPLLHFNYEAQFTPSCNKHDICYHCGHHFGITRSQCDHKFLHNMLATCTSRKRLINCQHSADAFFAAVRTAGGLFYLSEVPHYCTESWVKVCLT
uniref:Uncharacterized protein LOC111105348 n=1 Tax=Crassostrea virginica TaxID=6565 RepID=A0A8B8AW19_CRAVI|nr:uncharacterized protein LOC111105348 [Crassostrea virginica]